MVHTPHKYSFYKFYSNCTKVDLADLTSVRTKNTAKTSHKFEFAESSDPCSKAGISKSPQQQQETSEWFKTIDYSLLTTIDNNKREILISSSCHLTP